MEETVSSASKDAKPVTRRGPGDARAATGALVAAPEAGLAHPGLAVEERLALSLLVRHPPGTRAVYRRALRQWAAWCAARELRPVEARREHVELWMREQGAAGAAASTRVGRLAALTGFYEVAVDEGLLERNPAARVRRPRLDDDSQRLGVDRQEGSAILAAAEAASEEARRDADVALATRTRPDHLLACL